MLRKWECRLKIDASDRHSNSLGLCKSISQPRITEIATPIISANSLSKRPFSARFTWIWSPSVTTVVGNIFLRLLCHRKGPILTFIDRCVLPNSATRHREGEISAAVLKSQRAAFAKRLEAIFPLHVGEDSRVGDYSSGGAFVFGGHSVKNFALDGQPSMPRVCQIEECKFAG